MLYLKEAEGLKRAGATHKIKRGTVHRPISSCKERDHLIEVDGVRVEILEIESSWISPLEALALI